MDFEGHCRSSYDVLGDRFEQVHRWLDYSLWKYPYSERHKHRKHRHHWEGILKVEELFGTRAMYAAMLHVLDDNGGVIPVMGDYFNDSWAREFYGEKNDVEGIVDDGFLKMRLTNLRIDRDDFMDLVERLTLDLG